MSAMIGDLYGYLQGAFDDRYAPYVVGAYVTSAVILGWLLWSTLAANARARRELEDAEEARKR